MLRCVALVRTDVSEELSASFIRVTRIGGLGTTLAVTSNRQPVCVGCCMLRYVAVRAFRQRLIWVDLQYTSWPKGPFKHLG
jgi:hypothetical protein